MVAVAAVAGGGGIGDVVIMAVVVLLKRWGRDARECLLFVGAAADKRVREGKREWRAAGERVIRASER